MGSDVQQVFPLRPREKPRCGWLEESNGVNTAGSVRALVEAEDLGTQ